MKLLIQTAFLNDALDTSEFSSKADRKRLNFQCFSHFAFRILVGIVGVLALVSTASSQVNDTQDPTVTITSPAAGSTLRGTVTVSATAIDNVGVTEVDLYANEVIVGSATASPYTFSWNTSTVPDGSVMLKAVAYDAAGNHSNFVTNVTVANTTPPSDTQDPIVTITSPVAGNTLRGTVTVSATASDNVGVTKVDLYANEVIVGSATASPYTFSWNTSAVPDGSVMLKAVAYDGAGNHSNFVTNATVANATTSSPTLSVTSSNPTSGVSVRVYPADTSGLTDGTASLTRTYNANARVWLSAALRAGSNYFVKWQKDGTDYDTASSTSVVMDANHTLTAIYETPACTGIAVYPGTDSLKNAVAVSPAGSTFCIKAGIHRLTTSVIVRTNDKYIGETGAILNGSKVLSSFTPVGSYWVASGQYQHEPVFASALCLPSAPSCIYPEKVFFDGIDLWQVTSLAVLGPGQFYFDYANAQIYLFDNPTGHTVETTTGSGGIVGYSGGSGDFVTVKNLVFEKFGGGEVAGSADNALKAVNGWRVENNEFRLISFIAVANYGNGVVRNNYIHHNGQYGIAGGGTFEGNTISYNNTDGFNPNDDAGGGKFLRTIGLVIRGNTASSNTGRAFWADYDNINVTYENNIIENNTEMGIFHEVSCAAVIKNNVLRGNNTAHAGQSLWWGGQIYTRSSKDVQIFGNDLTAAGPGTNGVGVRGGDPLYTGPNCGTIQMQNIAVHDNVIRLDTGDMHGVVGGGVGYSATYNIQFTNNVYYLTNPAGAYFWNDAATSSMTSTQWQAQGQDLNSRFYQY
jgi:hypothetical protein